jgi:fructokinase
MHRNQDGHVRIYGAGLIALDAVVNEATPDRRRHYAGGTCGNVLAILSQMGWHAIPISRLAPDGAGKSVRKDMKSWLVDLEYVGIEPQAPTPMIIEEIYQNRSGAAAHRYSWRCPGCGRYLPQYRAVPGRIVVDLLPRLRPASVFFFDRVSRGTIELARHFASQGAAVVFEPSTAADPKLLREALRLCHVLKYSSQRSRAFMDLLPQSTAWLEIETLGEDGLCYRSSLPACPTRDWRHVKGFEVQKLKDAAGSGDWCTAGMISALMTHGVEGLAETTFEKLEGALRYGQALSAWNCGFEGPRGGMYALTRGTLNRVLNTLLTGTQVTEPVLNGRRRHAGSWAAEFCPACAPAKRHRRRIAVRTRTAMR